MPSSVGRGLMFGCTPCSGEKHLSRVLEARNRCTRSRCRTSEANRAATAGGGKKVWTSSLAQCRRRARASQCTLASGCGARARRRCMHVLADSGWAGSGPVCAARSRAAAAAAVSEGAVLAERGAQVGAGRCGYAPLQPRWMRRRPARGLTRWPVLPAAVPRAARAARTGARLRSARAGSHANRWCGYARCRYCIAAISCATCRCAAPGCGR